LLDRLVPDEAVARLCLVDLESLRARGITTILLDLDNTITPWRSHEVPEDLGEWIEEAKKTLRVCLVSNTSKMKRFDAVKERMGLEGRAFVCKPWGMRSAMRKLDVHREEAVAIGDQLLTDVLGGNMAGCYTILVKPVSDDEFIATKFIRWVEACCFGMLRRRGMFEKPWE